MSKKPIAIIANGTFNEPQIADTIRDRFSMIIAADGGLDHCHRMKIIPDLIIGDFDSASPEVFAQYQHIPQKKYPRDKDETDLELAIDEAFSLGGKKVVIFGALEKRIDHTLYNLHLLCKHPGQLSIESEYETIFAIHQSTEIPSFPGQIVSLLPIGDPVTGVTTKGLKWELDNAHFNHSLMSVSNVCQSTSFHVKLKKGILLCSLCKTIS